MFSNRNKRNGKLSTSANVTIADVDLAQLFLASYGSSSSSAKRLVVKGVATRVFESKRPVDPLRLAHVRANPFVSPRDDLERTRELERLRRPINLSSVDFGTCLIPHGTRRRRRVFSPVWTKSVEPSGKVYLDGDTRHVVVEFELESTDTVKVLVAVSSIPSIEVLKGDRGRHSILLSLNHAPTYHRSTSSASRDTSDLGTLLRDIFREMNDAGSSPGAQRVSAIDAEHGSIAAEYCSTRIALTLPSERELVEFKHRRSDRIRMPRVKQTRDDAMSVSWSSSSSDENLAAPYSPTTLGELKTALGSLSVPVAFQVETLLRSQETFDDDPARRLVELVPTLCTLEQRHGSIETERVVQQFGYRLRNRHDTERARRSESWTFDEVGQEWFDEFDETTESEPLTKPQPLLLTNSNISGRERLETELFELAARLDDDDRTTFGSSLSKRRDVFLCRHVILTPSRVLLEGPFPDDSNSIIRRFGTGMRRQDHFVRVSVRDEDGSTLMTFSREADVARFLNERFGRLFKHGLELAGTRFEFLGYSQSALKEHSTWFVAPFFARSAANGDREEEITASKIRQSLGDFSKGGGN